MAASTSLINRALKLRNMAADQSSPVEAERAAALYLELLKKHCLNEADVDAAAGRPADPIEARELVIDGLRLCLPDERESIQLKVAEWKRLLMCAVAKYCCCRSSFVIGTQWVTLYGHKSDIDAACELFRICAAQIDRECKAHLQKKADEAANRGRYWGKSEGRSAGFAFRESAVRGLESTLDDLMAESSKAEAESHALVVNRKKEVDDWVDASYSFKKVKVGGRADWSQEGYTAGQNLKLNDDDRSLAGSAIKGLIG